jgi:hypothetical protein
MTIFFFLQRFPKELQWTIALAFFNQIYYSMQAIKMSNFKFISQSYHCIDRHVAHLRQLTEAELLAMDGNERGEGMPSRPEWRDRFL